MKFLRKNILLQIYWPCFLFLPKAAVRWKNPSIYWWNSEFTKGNSITLLFLRGSKRPVCPRWHLSVTPNIPYPTCSGTRTSLNRFRWPISKALFLTASTFTSSDGKLRSWRILGRPPIIDLLSITLQESYANSANLIIPTFGTDLFRSWYHFCQEDLFRIGQAHLSSFKDDRGRGVRTAPFCQWRQKAGQGSALYFWRNIPEQTRKFPIFRISNWHLATCIWHNSAIYLTLML